MYTVTSEFCIFPDIFLLQDTATWDKMQSTGFNFCCLMVPSRKAHLAYGRYKYSPKTAFFTLQILGEHLCIRKLDVPKLITA